MTGYTVKPRGVTSQIKHGGFVVYEMDGHGLVAAITDLGQMDWNSAKTACDELILNGYSDWHLPTKDELNALYVNLKMVGVGGFADKYYWSSSEISINLSLAGLQGFSNGDQGTNEKYLPYYVRAIRAF